MRGQRGHCRCGFIALHPVGEPPMTAGLRTRRGEGTGAPAGSCPGSPSYLTASGVTGGGIVAGQRCEYRQAALPTHSSVNRACVATPQLCVKWSFGATIDQVRDSGRTRPSWPGGRRAQRPWTWHQAAALRPGYIRPVTLPSLV